MSYNIGLNVVEVNGTGAPAIAGAATSVAAFNILTTRGLPNSPARINSFADFAEKFGGHDPAAYGSYLVKGFFDNDGSVAYVNRVVAAAGTSVASVTLQDSGPLDTLRFEGGYRGEADPGSWGRELYVLTTRVSAVAGRRLAETAAATVQTLAALPAATDLVAAVFPDLVVTIDGAATPTTITFNAGQFVDPAAATRAEIVDAINTATADLAAGLTGADELQLTSNGNIALLAGGFTSLDVAANATLGFPAAQQSVATTSGLGAGGATLHSIDGLKAGDIVLFDDGVTNETVKLQSVNVLTRAVTWAAESLMARSTSLT